MTSAPGPVTMHLESDVVECGDVVRGVVKNASSGGALVISLEVVVAPVGDGREQRTATDSTSSRHATNAAELSFALEVPADGPITFSGTTMAVSWQVVAVAAGAADEALATQAVTILPEGGVAVWVRQHGEPPTRDSDVS